MDKERNIHFVGGPLHGESRVVPDGASRDTFTVTQEAAGALRAAIRGEEDPSEPVPTVDLTYVKRRDGRFYLAIDKPEGIKDPPSGFTGHWFDAGDGMSLLELHAPDSDWGHGWTDITVTPEFLADLEGNQEGTGIYQLAMPGIYSKERQMVRRIDGRVLADLAGSMETGSATARKAGNRRLIAAVLRDYEAGRIPGRGQG